MRILILGGTVFVGRHLTEAALAAGHEVTLFNRGQHNPDLYAQVEKLRGNRDGDLEALRGGRWDAVIDPSGYVPRIVRASAELLADAVEHYTFISSLSVYADTTQPGIDETAPVAVMPAGLENTEDITGESYGPLKVLAERAVEETLPGRTLVVRPGLIVGPHDPSNRFTYWPVRVAQGGEVLAPDQPSHPVQFIDVRDLAEWIIRLVEGKATGTLNATGPADPLTLGSLLDTCKAITGSGAQFTWVPEAFLLEHKVAPYTEMPLWVPSEEAGFGRFNVARAIAAGLTYRRLGDTVRDTLAWDRSLPADAERRHGLKPEREAELLAAWHALNAEAPAA
jgi:2'-hydroxyisoflavone reductase